MVNNVLVLPFSEGSARTFSRSLDPPLEGHGTLYYCSDFFVPMGSQHTSLYSDNK